MGTTASTQRAFIALQTEINRVGVGYGITRLSTDGKLGPATLQSMLNLAGAIQRKLGSNTDSIIEQVIFGFGDGAPTSTRDLALSAEEITAALRRDGAAEQPWSVIQSIKDMAQQVIATGAAQPSVPPVPASPVNPYPTTAPVSPPTTTASPMPVYPPTPATWPGWHIAPTPLIPTWAKVLGGVTLLAFAVGIGFAVARAAR